jgi:hypothetical protein
VCGLESAVSGWVPVESSCKHGNKSSGSLKGGEFIDLLNDYEFHKEDFVPWSNLILYLSSSILSRGLKITVYGRTILPVSYTNVKLGVYPKEKA